MTLNLDFKVTPLFDATYLRDGTIQRYSYNGILIGTYTYLSDLERLGAIQLHEARAACLRQLSFLSE